MATKPSPRGDTQLTVPDRRRSAARGYQRRSEDVTADPVRRVDSVRAELSAETNCWRRRDWTRITRTISVSSLGPARTDAGPLVHASTSGWIQLCG
ncbi:hypothetical protein C8039_04505 [Halogeometricum sp. wsp3]|nr:hypothetical protein C8039_04505 [Halogeometricum sp. wsp3]